MFAGMLLAAAAATAQPAYRAPRTAGSKPDLTGPVGSGPLTVLGAHGEPPSLDEVREAVARTAR